MTLLARMLHSKTNQTILKSQVGTTNTFNLSTESMIVYLIGFMGTGKSTLGKRLASRLGYSFVDLDDLIVEYIGCSIPDYFQKYGEEQFRMVERTLLHQTKDRQNIVLSTGGGTPCFYDNMAWINQHGISIYLKCPLEILYGRLKNATSERPMLKNLEGEALKQFIQERVSQREPFYEQAQHTVWSLNQAEANLYQLVFSILNNTEAPQVDSSDSTS